MWTIGHSTRSLETLVALLRAHGIERVADVRRFPRSRRHPHMNTEALARDLPDAGIAYRHFPGLGGFRRARPDSRNTAWRNASFRGYADYMQTDEFARHLAALLDEARLGSTTIMCAEAVPWRCHRSLISDALLARGVEVRHILGPAPGRAAHANCRRPGGGHARHLPRRARFVRYGVMAGAQSLAHSRGIANLVHAIGVGRGD